MVDIFQLAKFKSCITDILTSKLIICHTFINRNTCFMQKTQLMQDLKYDWWWALAILFTTLINVTTVLRILLQYCYFVTILWSILWAVKAKLCNFVLHEYGLYMNVYKRFCLFFIIWTPFELRMCYIETFLQHYAELG